MEPQWKVHNSGGTNAFFKSSATMLLTWRLDLSAVAYDITTFDISPPDSWINASVNAACCIDVIVMRVARENNFGRFRISWGMKASVPVLFYWWWLSFLHLFDFLHSGPFQFQNEISLVTFLFFFQLILHVQTFVLSFSQVFFYHELQMMLSWFHWFQEFKVIRSLSIFDDDNTKVSRSFCSIPWHFSTAPVVCLLSWGIARSL